MNSLNALNESTLEKSASSLSATPTQAQEADGLGWMSLQGRWARLMADGSKTVEWRKSAPARLDGGVFVLWESAPGAQALALGRATKIWRAPWQELFERFGVRGMATQEELAAYYGQKPSALAIEVELVERFARPIPWRLIKPLAGGFSPGPAPRWLEGEQATQVLSALRQAQALLSQEPATENGGGAPGARASAPLKNRGPWRA